MIGQILHGKYRLVRLLGDGGMGAVYEASHERLGTRVAIKVLHAEIARRPGIVDRFLQEARVSAQIRSLHVAQVIDVDQTSNGDAYMVMELLLGETLLSALERERKLPLRVATDYAHQILEGLEAAHALGVVHRDLKPENVFITSALAARAAKPTLKLIDFGIAKVRRADLSSALTLAGVAMGTAEYMAPEQAFSANVADARSDVYAVGVMLYEMLSGQRPVVGDDPRVIALKVERGELKSLVHLAPEVPGPLAGLVHRAMAARPEMRFQSATEMRAALDALGGPAAAESDPALSATAEAHPATFRQPSGTLGLGAASPRPPSTLRGTPVEPHAFGPVVGAAPADAERDPEPESVPGARGVPRRGGAGIGLLLLAVLLGVGVVVALAMAQHPRRAEGGSASQSTPNGSLAAVTATASATDDGASLRPLFSATARPTGAVTTPSTAKPVPSPRPSGSSSTRQPDASTTTGPLPTVPSALPNPFPSTIPPLPTSIPSSFSTTFTLPGFGPPPEGPAPP